MAVVLFVLAAAPVRAQQDGGPSSVEYGASAEGSLATGNVRRLLVTLRGDVSWTGSTLGLAFEPTFVYGEQGDAVRERDLLARGFLYLYPRRRWFGFMVAGVETSRSRRLDHRSQIGLGVGRRLVESAGHDLRVTLAMLRERSELEHAAPTDQWRVTARAKGAHRHARFRLQEEVWWQPAFRGAPGQRWHAEARLDITLVRALTFRTSIDEHYESLIAPGIRANDFRLTFGIAISSRATP